MSGGAARAPYPVPAAPAAAELRERGSRFVAVIAPAASETEARRAIEAARERHRDATHHCWAWRLGAIPDERSSDAGEPRGTAGEPILRALRGAGLHDVVAVVTRWFGGTRLGKGGLARAYAAAAGAAAARVEKRLEVPRVVLELEVAWDRLGAVRALLRPGEVELAGERYGDGAELALVVAVPALAATEEALAALGLGFVRRVE